MSRRRSARSQIRAELIGKNASASDALSKLTNTRRGATKRAVDPPYDFKGLYFLYENSAILRPNVEAYVTNIDSFGHHYTPSIDLAASDADIRIADAIHYERFLALQNGEITEDEFVEPTDSEVEDRKEQLRKRARLELSRLRAFFAFSTPELSFVELRRRTRQDLEVTGNAFWEINRNKLGEIARFIYVPPIDMRLSAADKEPTVVQEPVHVTDITWGTQQRVHYFRRFLQVSPGGKDPIYFKEFGDPRVISRKTGIAYKSVEELKKREENCLPATEILHFRIFTPNSAYGIPRWTPNLPAVLGSRELDEVNLNYFKNNVVPPMALLVSGGRFNKGVAAKIEEFIDEHLKGKKGMHRMLVLEAEGQKAAGEPGPKLVPRIQFVPLRDAQQQDALFQEYDKRNDEKVSKSFRLPRILRGDDTAINRATAFASLRFAEEQVFEPERESFDCIINRQIFPELGIRFWEFRSNGPVVRDPEKMTEMVANLAKVGVILPAEARELASDIFNRAFREISEEWTNRPLPLTIAQLRANNEASSEALDPNVGIRPSDQDEMPRPAVKGQPNPKLRRAGQPLDSRGFGIDDVEL